MTERTPSTRARAGTAAQAGARQKPWIRGNVRWTLPPRRRTACSGRSRARGVLHDDDGRLPGRGRGRGQRQPRACQQAVIARARPANGRLGPHRRSSWDGSGPAPGATHALSIGAGAAVHHALRGSRAARQPRGGFRSDGGFAPAARRVASRRPQTRRRRPKSAGNPPPALPDRHPGTSAAAPADDCSMSSTTRLHRSSYTTARSAGLVRVCWSWSRMSRSGAR